MRSLIAAVCLLSLGAGCARPHPHPQPVPPAPPSPQRPNEIRAVWVSDTPRLDWDEATRDLQRAGFNTMYVNLASGGAAFFPHCRAVPSVVDDDAVARGIALAHRRGLAVHAKLIVMFMFKAPLEFQRRLIRQDRVMRGADGKPILQSGNPWLCPSQPENRAQVAGVITELLNRYPVDGLQFDYIRFFEEPTCFCGPCRREFEKFAGKPVRHWPVDASQVEQFNQWRQQLITDWARQLSGLARQARPGLKVTAAVFPILARAKEEKAQDWRLWLERGYLDYVCTMNYSTDASEFEARGRAANAVAPRDRIVVGIASWKMQRLGEVQAQIGTTRRLGTLGFALFSYDDAAARELLPALR